MRAAHVGSFVKCFFKKITPKIGVKKKDAQ